MSKFEINPVVAINTTAGENASLAVAAEFIKELHSNISGICEEYIMNLETGEVIEIEEIYRVLGILHGLTNSNTTNWEIH